MGVKQIPWANYLFGSLEEKSSSVSRLATSTDAEIVERISESVTSYVRSRMRTSLNRIILTVFTIKPKSPFQTEPC